MIVELIKWKPYSFPALWLFEGKEDEVKEPYIVDISRAEQIFDYLVKDQKVWLLEDRKSVV